jgi:hypothetical protein
VDSSQSDAFVHNPDLKFQISVKIFDLNETFDSAGTREDGEGGGHQLVADLQDVVGP